MDKVGFNVIYDAVQPYLAQRILELEPPQIAEMDTFEYIQTASKPTNLTERLLAHLKTYKSVASEPAPEATFPTLGPIETEALQFVVDPHVRTCALVGGLGCGKTTTIRYLIRHHLKALGFEVNYIDFKPIPPPSADPGMAEEDAWMLSEINHPGLVQQALVETTGRFVHALLSPEEELDAMWTWATQRPPEDPAARIMETLEDALRFQPPAGSEPTGVTADVLAARSKARESVGKKWTLDDRLRYYLLCVHYLVSAKGMRILFALDNLDHAPPASHYGLMIQGQGIAALTGSQVLLALRPLVYVSASAAFGQGETVFYHIEHEGPGLEAVLRSRIEGRVTGLSDRELADALGESFEDFPRHRVENVAGSYWVRDGEWRIPLSHIRRWCETVMNVLCPKEAKAGKPRPSDTPDAAYVVSLLSAGSLRIAKLLAAKVLQAHAVAFEKVLGVQPTGRDALRKKPGVKPQRVAQAHSTARRDISDNEAIRGMLIREYTDFRPTPTRTITNLFHTRCGLPGGLTCKLRILKFLQRHAEGGCTLAELCHWTNLFRYPEGMVKEALNALIHQKRRLVWSDCLGQVEGPLPPYGRARLNLAPAGEGYLEYLSLNLEYLQHMVLSSNTNQTYSLGRDLPHRVLDMARFARALFDQDETEVRGIIFDGRNKEYCAVYEDQLFSGAIVISAWKQIRRVASLAELTQQARESLSTNMGEWENFFIPRVKQVQRELSNRLAGQNTGGRL